MLSYGSGVLQPVVLCIVAFGRHVFGLLLSSILTPMWLEFVHANSTISHFSAKPQLAVLILFQSKEFVSNDVAEQTDQVSTQLSIDGM